MGDWVDVDICERKEEETKLLSPTHHKTHHRSVSYGSFLPIFKVDALKLENLLPEEDENEVTSIERGKAHCRVDSLIDSSCDAPESFLLVLEQQLESLFTFVSLHLSRVEEDMDNFEKRKKAEALLEVVSNTSDSDASTNVGDDDLDRLSVGMDSGIEDDHLNSAKGFLSRIKDVLRNLKTSLDTSMEQLDKLVGMYDHRTQDDAAQILLNGHREKNAQLRDKIECFISEVDTKLEQCVDDRGTSQKLLELRTLERAKKERMRFLDFLGFLLLLLSAASLTYFSTSHPSSRWIILLRLLRSPLLVVGYMYLVGFNMMAWARSGINYISIFNFPRNSSPTPKFMFQVASILSLLFTLMVVLCLVTSSDALYISDKVIGFAMWTVIAIFWINPFNILNRLGRFSFLLVFVRVLMAPFPAVMFADFWFADQLNSLLAFLLDIQYLFCYSLTPSSWDKDTLALKNCTMVSNGVRPIISCLPALWRLLQCLRCYQKTRKVAHLFNAVKYFTTFPVVVFATFFAVNVKPFSSLGDIDLSKTGWMILAWLISSLIHALFTFYWDIVMDWGLFRVREGFPFRPTLLYHKWTYLVAICIDFVIRFACAAKLTLAIVYHIDSDVIYTLLILSEILRRVLWNFFRIEYEQVLRST